MHPILARKERLGLYVAAWAPVAAMFAGFLIFTRQMPWGGSLLFAVPLTLVYAFLCLATWYLCRAFPLGTTGLARLAVVFSVAAALSSAFWFLLGRLWISAWPVLPALKPFSDRYASLAPHLIAVGMMLFILAAAVHYLMEAFETSREAENRALELQILAREAELKALRAQVDPHFLFNCLNSISALTSADPGRARTMCQLLASFLRKSLDLGARDLIPLEDELSLVGDFLEIEKVRLGSRLQVALEIAEPARSCRVPALLLQPLVENAIRHGVSTLLEGGEIRLTADRKSGSLLIRVENPCDPDRRASTSNGLGLANVRNRLATRFGPEAHMEVDRTSGRFGVALSLPAGIEES